MGIPLFILTPPPPNRNKTDKRRKTNTNKLKAKKNKKKHEKQYPHPNKKPNKYFLSIYFLDNVCYLHSLFFITIEYVRVCKPI